MSWSVRMVFTRYAMSLGIHIPLLVDWQKCMCLLTHGQKVRAAFVPNHKLKWTGKVFARSTFDASLVEGIKDLPADSTHWVRILSSEWVL